MGDEFILAEIEDYPGWQRAGVILSTPVCDAILTALIF